MPCLISPIVALAQSPRPTGTPRPNVYAYNSMVASTAKAWMLYHFCVYGMSKSTARPQTRAYAADDVVLDDVCHSGICRDAAAGAVVDDGESAIGGVQGTGVEECGQEEYWVAGKASVGLKGLVGLWERGRLPPRLKMLEDMRKKTLDELLMAGLSQEWAGRDEEDDGEEEEADGAAFVARKNVMAAFVQRSSDDGQDEISNDSSAVGGVTRTCSVHKHCGSTPK
ncbi:hypothetical protein VE01_07768 [Pseudogymnoascus verrucosus]|uniref:Uncharacterized protein n=1 Tax=Pseudogymnoascus verrucosus TaxID=342668 RepID=A0A1B8GES3_9PEZI|nr:uncharacterized protein VE01_07768 [Pseudogymnoascus verrucosus]OBT94335.1 hypothetical protein VE01_07768 [Pseudogymnoascus verrucosus]